MDLLKIGDSVSTYGKFWADNYGRNLGGLEVWDLLKMGESLGSWEIFGGCRTDNYGRNLGGLEVWDLLKLGKILGGWKIVNYGRIFSGGSKKKTFLGSPPAKNETIKLEISGF